MTAPEFHSDDFTTRRDAPAMSTISRGHRITVSYHPRQDDTRRQRTVSGTVSYAGYGQFEDTIEFTPAHTSNKWRLVINDNGLSLYYQWGSGNDKDWRRLDEPQLETTAHVKPGAP